MSAESAQPEPGRFAVATPHEAATRAAEAAFNDGGNAVDAALAAACMLTVVYPHMCSVGGDALVLVRDRRTDARGGGDRHDNAGDGIVAINGSGRSARAWPGPQGGTMPVRGGEPITVPGVAAAWQTMADRFGDLPLAAALERAAESAANGVGVAPSLAKAVGAESDLVLSDRGMAGVFAPDGVLLSKGDTFVQEALAKTLRRMATAGVRDFYEGEIAAKLLASLAASGSQLSADDFKEHHTDVEEPLRMSWRGYELATMAANSQGVSLFQILAAGDLLGLDDPLGKDAAKFAALFYEAAADRDRYLGDADAMDRETAALIEEPALHDLIGRAAAHQNAGNAHPRASGDTVAIVAADSSGLSVSVIQSVFYVFGSGVLDPTTGVLFHNRGAFFSAEPGLPNTAGPAKRPLHTLMPVLADRDGRPALVAGTMGGHAQAQIHAQLLHRIAAGAGVAAAISAPRFVVGSMDTGGAAIDAESDFGAAIGAFSASELQFSRIEPHSEDAGHSQLIQIDKDGGMTAASDPRSDGEAIVGESGTRQ